MVEQQMQSRPPATETAAEARLVKRSDLSLSAPWVEPGTEAEAGLAAIWREVLGIDAVGTSDDFFELGGDSFAATALAAQVEATFGIRFAPSDIINSSTVAKQAQLVASQALDLTPKLPSHLVLGRAGGSQPPVFMVHGGLGFAFFKPDFLEEVGRDRPVYLFQAPGLDGRVRPLASVEELATLYVDTIRQIQPAGPYNIVGMCAGSFIALEMCHQLNEAGESIAHLVLLDPPVAPPSTKEMRAEIKAKRAHEAKSPAGSALSRIFRLFGESNGGRGEKPTRAHKRVVKMQSIAERIKQDVEQKSPEQAAYTAETTARVVELLKVAFDKHVPRPYPGKVAMLVSSAKARKMVGPSAFWPNHLGGLEYQVCDGDHQGLFRVHLTETARFVRHSLT
jgi:thioesterase domain-containing protein/acyl carrier protein